MSCSLTVTDVCSSVSPLRINYKLNLTGFCCALDVQAEVITMMMMKDDDDEDNDEDEGDDDDENDEDNENENELAAQRKKCAAVH